MIDCTKRRGKLRRKQMLKYDQSMELLPKMLCTKCKKKEAYWSCEWCADCVWSFVKEDQGPISYTREGNSYPFIRAALKNEI